MRAGEWGYASFAHYSTVRGHQRAPGGKELVELFCDIVHLHNVLQPKHKLVLLKQLHLPPLCLQPVIVRAGLQECIFSDLGLDEL